MSDTSAFIAGCATTGAAALMLLLARISLSESSPTVETGPQAPLSESVVPVPSPPPDAIADSSLQEELQADLEEQQAITDQLEAKVAQQDLLIQDLEAQIERQQEANETLNARLDAYERSVNTLSSQQEQLVGVQRNADKTQTSLLWVGAGLVLVVLVGGALVLVILVLLVAFQSRNNSRGSRPGGQIIYSTDVPPGYPYYQQEFLAPHRPRRIYQQDLYDYD